MKLINLGAGLEHILDTELINDDSVIIDAGANIGEFVEKMRTITNAKIYSIECSAYNYKVLCEKQYENVKTYERALVGTKVDKVTLTEYAGKPKSDGHPRFNQWCNIYDNYNERFTADPDVKVVKYDVGTITLSELIKENNIQSIDYLKMDVEGAEYDIIENLTQEEPDIIKQISMEPHDRSKNTAMVQKLENLGFFVISFPALDNPSVGEYYAYKPEAMLINLKHKDLNGLKVKTGKNFKIFG